MRIKKLSVALFVLLAAGSQSSCMTAYKKTLGEDTNKVFNKLYGANMNVAWESCKEALKAMPIEVENREAGYIQTKWVENSSTKSLTDFYGESDSFAKAQYRIKVTVSGGIHSKTRKQSVKVSVQKDQIVQRDALEGWRLVETDSIEENTLLYRIGRIISIKTRLTAIEDEQIKKAVEQNAPM